MHITRKTIRIHGSGFQGIELWEGKRGDAAFLPAWRRTRRSIVYCNSGGRSYTAYRKLQKMDYKNIAQALFADWKGEGLPVAR